MVICHESCYLHVLVAVQSVAFLWQDIQDRNFVLLQNENKISTPLFLLLMQNKDCFIASPKNELSNLLQV